MGKDSGCIIALERDALMVLEMVLNELSYQVPANNRDSAREWMNILLETIRRATSTGIKHVLRTGQEFYTIELAKDYTIANWFNDIDSDTRVYIKTITTKYPYLEGLDQSLSPVDVDLIECWYNGRKADGFKCAYWMDALALSFYSNDEWDKHIIDNIILTYIDKGSDGIKEEIVQIRHASKPKHIKKHLEWINECIKDSIRDGIDIWKRRNEFYPSLLFCQSVRQQLYKIYQSHVILNRIKRSLSELQKYCENWVTGGFEPENITGKPRMESKPTLQQYGKERTFVCPDGKQRKFSWHLSLSYTWRLYFYPLENEKKIIIGYIGQHLPIVSEK